MKINDILSRAKLLDIIQDKEKNNQLILSKTEVQKKVLIFKEDMSYYLAVFDESKDLSSFMLSYIENIDNLSSIHKDKNIVCFMNERKQIVEEIISGNAIQIYTGIKYLIHR